MDERQRAKKRTVIGAIFFALIVAGGILVYFVFRPPATCSDGKQNQDETGIDCGGSCQAVCQEVIAAEDVVIMETVFVPAGPSRFDLLAKIRNPNPDAGATRLAYTFLVRDADGALVGTYPGESFLLPGEEKYLLELNRELAGAATVALEINDLAWERLANYRGKPAVNIYQRRYTELSGSTAFAEAYGVVANESPFDFRSLRVRVVLRDASDRPLATHMTEMRTVRAGEERDFRLLWPTSFPGTVSKVEMEAEADVYSSENFIREYLPGGRFQEFVPPAF